MNYDVLFYTEGPDLGTIRRRITGRRNPRDESGPFESRQSCPAKNRCFRPRSIRASAGVRGFDIV